ncbi:hypothetical protein NEFER03_2085 [Nematocida sp. LUAm3]|nr:hypothetical protein NEFER03_2085 [Nematocida sp. LUAm3]KAI5176197.1 hypothetical protein NEFER02_2003 [Nematocida sp. LUAm2]KAI5179185.1 hypothetical protein NEFER01_2042 [Nematocida sp. LUAm1]
MRRVLPLMYAVITWCMVRERPLELIGLTEKLSVVHNGEKQGDSWMLKGHGKGSLVNFINKNENQDEWSVEMHFRVPDLMHTQFAGIYLWYTVEQIAPGEYKGAQGRFNGLVAGIEFLGKSVDLMVSVNHGEEDYAGLRSEDTELRDAPEPSIFRGHRELTLKVISTAKNFKVEVYGEDKHLLYDKIRYTSMTEIGSRLSGKYFGVSTDYHENMSAEGIVLNEVLMRSREEGELYDPDTEHTVVKEVAPRAPSEVNHPQEEVQHTISMIEHLTKYLRIVLGEPIAKPINENVLYIKKLMNFQSAHILELRDLLQGVIEVCKKNAEKERIHRDEILSAIKHVHTVYESRDMDSRRNKSYYPVFGVILFSFVSFLGGYMLAVRLTVQKKVALH